MHIVVLSGKVNKEEFKYVEILELENDVRDIFAGDPATKEGYDKQK
ncbi:MAG: hypothetical protein AAGE96_08675 [Cyanobacteria bacterium P01_G01_bin.19]